MSEWTCPTHGAAKVRISSKSGLPFCAAKMPDGSWCPNRPPKPAAASTPAALQVASQGAVNGSRAEFLACLDFALKVHAGRLEVEPEAILAFAKKTYEALPQ